MECCDAIYQLKFKYVLQIKVTLRFLFQKQTYSLSPVSFTSKRPDNSEIIEIKNNNYMCVCVYIYTIYIVSITVFKQCVV